MAFHTICVVFLYLLLTIVCVVGGLSMLFGFNLYRYRTKYGHLPSPPRESIFFGHLSHVTAVRKKTDISLVTLLYQWHRDFGSVYCIRFITQEMVVCSEAQTIKNILLDSRHLKPVEMYRFFYSIFGQRFMGNGLVSELNHGKWHVKRAIMNPAFNRRYLMLMMDQFNECAESLCEHLLPLADGKTLVTMLDEFNSVTLDVMSKVGFNLNVNSVNDPNNPFPTAVTLTLQGMNRTFAEPASVFDPRSAARKYRREVRDACRLVRKIGRECIEERVAAMRRGDELPHDILTCILRASDDLKTSHEFGMEEMLDEFSTFFVAGQETSSNLLSFTLLEIGRHPDVVDRLKAEVDDVLGQKSSVEYSDIGRLEYMTRVFKETLRLCPPVTGTSRSLAFDIESAGYKIPKGSCVLFPMYVTSRMEEYYDDPLLFNPDRFIPTDELPRHLYAYFPFSLGQRNCIGQQLALIESKVILGKLLQRFDFRLEQSQRHLLRDEVTNKPIDRCKNYISLRD